MNDWMRWGIGITAGVLFSLFIVPTLVPFVGHTEPEGHYSYTFTLLTSMFCMSVFFTIPITWFSSRSVPVTRTSGSDCDPIFLSSSKKRRDIGFCFFVFFIIAILVWFTASGSKASDGTFTMLDKYLMWPSWFAATVGIYFKGTLQCAYCARLNVPMDRYCTNCDNHLHVHRPARNRQQ